MASLDNIKSYLEEYAELKRIEKNVKERMKELDPLVRPMLVDQGPQHIDNYQFECVTMPGRKSVDKKAVAAAGIDLSRFEKVGAPYTQLKIVEMEKSDV